jgi:Protein of unknown function (DUF1552)
MFITKASLSRRTVLRGLGATLSLPLLEAMVPAMTATVKTAASPTKRFGAVFVPMGERPSHWTPTTTGVNFEFSPILKPIESFRDSVIVVSNIDRPLQGTHAVSTGTWLTGSVPKRTEAEDFVAGTSLDQIIAGTIGRDTVFPSLEIGTEDFTGYVGACDVGYSCTYMNTISWKTPTTPMPMESNPRAVFERMFGEGGSSAERSARLKQDRSVLDLAMEDMARLTRKLGSRDRTTVDEYLTAVRDVEGRIQRAERQTGEASASVPEQPVGIPDSFDDHAKLMFDLNFLAYQADVTRVTAFQISRELSGRAYPWIGVPDGHHTVSHHQLDPEKIAKESKINAYHMSLFARLIEKMKNTPDGDGSLLDHAILMYGTGMGDSDHHTPVNIPVVLAGGGCGTLAGGRHLEYPDPTPLTNLGLTILHKVGVDAKPFADSTGPLADL